MPHSFRRMAPMARLECGDWSPLSTAWCCPTPAACCRDGRGVPVAEHWSLLKTAASCRCPARTRFPERRRVAALQTRPSGLESGQFKTRDVPGFRQRCGPGRAKSAIQKAAGSASLFYCIWRKTGWSGNGRGTRWAVLLSGCRISWKLEVDAADDLNSATARSG